MSTASNVHTSSSSDCFIDAAIFQLLIGIKNTCCNEVITGHPLQVVVAEPTGDSKTTWIISMSIQEKARNDAQIHLIDW